MNERTNDDACVRPSVDGGGGRSHVPFPEPSSCLRSSFVRILRARATFISIIRFSAPSVENPSLGVRTSTSFHFISFARRFRTERKPTAHARAGGGVSYRIARVLGPVRTFLSRRVVPRARHPSIHRTRKKFQRSFVPARLSTGESSKGCVYRFRTVYTMRWGLRVLFMCDFQTIEIRNPWDRPGTDKS